MITDTLQQIVGRIVTDNDFRGRFFDQNAQALDNYELTDHERAVLSAMSTCPMTKLALATVAFRYHRISSKIASTAQA